MKQISVREFEFTTQCYRERHRHTKKCKAANSRSVPKHKSGAERVKVVNVLLLHM